MLRCCGVASGFLRAREARPIGAETGETGSDSDVSFSENMLSWKWGTWPRSPWIYTLYSYYYVRLIPRHCLVPTLPTKLSTFGFVITSFPHLSCSLNQDKNLKHRAFKATNYIHTTASTSTTATYFINDVCQSYAISKLCTFVLSIPNIRCKQTLSTSLLNSRSEMNEN